MNKKKYESENYCHVDEDFISLFEPEHRAFMKRVYYKVYEGYCKEFEIKSVSSTDFFKNMRRRKIQLCQLCCPYCRKITIIEYDKRIINLKREGMYYCFNCGRSAITNTVKEHISKYIKISNVIKLGLTDSSEKTEELLGLDRNDCYQMELIELATIIEVVFRDCFEALMFVKNYGAQNDYMEQIVKKHTGNDFMNIDKANNHYKRALDINLKDVFTPQVWNDLIDIVSIRNVIVHNNGRADNKFKDLPSYIRLQDKMEEDYFKLEEADLDHYFESVNVATGQIIEVYYEKYVKYRNAAIANHFFNMRTES